MKAMKKLTAVGLTLAMIITSIAALPVFAAESDELTPNTSWYTDHETETSYTIHNLDDLAGLAELVNSGTNFSGKTITLDPDNTVLTDADGTRYIDMTGIAWTPIGNNRDAANFAGTFDGGNVTFKNLTLTANSTADGNNLGLFGYAWGANISNITMDNATVTGNSNVSAVIGVIVGNVENCNTYNSNITGKYCVGGVVGWGYANYKDCTVDNTKVTGTYTIFTFYDDGDNIGGLTGFLGEGTYNIENCNASNITIVGYRDVGGLVGSASGTTTNVVTFDGCEVSGDVTARGSTIILSEDREMIACAGGIIGRSLAHEVEFINNTTFTGQVTAPNDGNRYAGTWCGYDINTKGAINQPTPAPDAE